MPGHIHKKGNVGIVSRSGTLTYEAVWQLTTSASASRPRRHRRRSDERHQFIDVLKMFNEDPETEAIIMIGEIGGTRKRMRRSSSRTK